MVRIVDILPQDAFYLSSHQQIYQAALELYRQNKPTDLLAVTAWLSDKKLLTSLGGQNKLTVGASTFGRYTNSGRI